MKRPRSCCFVALAVVTAVHANVGNVPPPPPPPPPPPIERRPSSIDVQNGADRNSITQSNTSTSPQPNGQELQIEQPSSPTINNNHHEDLYALTTNLERTGRLPLPPSPTRKNTETRSSPAVPAPLRMMPQTRARPQFYPQRMAQQQPPRLQQIPAWKRLWTKVESSLDGLALLEDVVQERASKLWSAAVPLQQPASKDPRAHKHGVQEIPVLDLARFQKKRSESQQPQQDTAAPNRQPIPMNAFERLQRQSKERQPIRVKGGSSAPHQDATQQSNPTIVSPLRTAVTTTPEQQHKTVASDATWRSSTTKAAWTNHQQPVLASTNSRVRNQHDDDDDRSIVSRLRLLQIPRLRLFRFKGRSFRHETYAALDVWKADDDEAAGRKSFFNIFQRQIKERKNDAATAQHPDDATMSPLLTSLMDRCQNGKSATLLTVEDKLTSVSIGRTRAVMDVVALFFFLIAVRQVLDIGLLQVTSIPDLLVAAKAVADSWTPFALVAALLANMTGSIWNVRVERLCESVQGSIYNEARYASLFLRLFMSFPLHAPDPILAAAQYQIMEKVAVARLRGFVSFLMSALVVMTVSFLKPLWTVHADFVARQLSSLEHLRSLQWSVGGIKSFFYAYTQSLMSILSESMSEIAEHPMRIAYQASILFVLAAVTLIPRIEKRRTPKPLPKSEDEAEDLEAIEAHRRLSEQVSDLGVSSASRLSILAESGAIENLLDRWRLMIPTNAPSTPDLSVSSYIRIMVYNLLSSVLLFSPIVAFSYGGISLFGSVGPFLRWDSLFDVGIVLALTHGLVRKALVAAVLSKDSERSVAPLLQTLGNALKSRKESIHSQPNLQLQASINPAVGLSVKDLWAAHASKRAWAVRGANLACRNGETLLIFGEEGSGKSRLMTTLAEALADPPRQALSATRVRGTITYGGVEINKWDKQLLRRRLGLYLNDVRTLADVSKVLSGLTIEEILEPTSGGSKPVETVRKTMILALKITNLYSTLLPRLPSKLSTVVTANEEDLRPSSLRPRCTILSPVEWSKLLLARVLAQAIYANENAASNLDLIENCLVGSIFLLDDVTAHFSELDEARLLQDLRKTGAATVIASNRWATGRFADTIAVLRDGAIVESGTHGELLNRGPQYSLYASHWHAMATQ
jgi:ABC-type multidrug transport system fused ATPase/permease subunit